MIPHCMALYMQTLMSVMTTMEAVKDTARTWLVVTSVAVRRESSYRLMESPALVSYQIIN